MFSNNDSKYIILIYTLKKDWNYIVLIEYLRLNWVPHPLKLHSCRENSATCARKSEKINSLPFIYNIMNQNYEKYVKKKVLCYFLFPIFPNNFYLQYNIKQICKTYTIKRLPFSYISFLDFLLSCSEVLCVKTHRVEKPA